MRRRKAQWTPFNLRLIVLSLQPRSLFCEIPPLVSSAGLLPSADLFPRINTIRGEIAAARARFQIDFDSTGPYIDCSASRV
jgi:hypothetical protein